MKPTSRFRLLLSIALATFPAHGWGAGAPADSGAPELEALLKRGESLLQMGDAGEARSAFADADREAAGQSVEALVGLARADLALKNLDRVIASAEKLLALTEEPFWRAYAFNLRGLALVDLAQREEDEQAKIVTGNDRFEIPGKSQVEQAESDFRAVLELSEGRANAARLNLAEALAWLGRPAEARGFLAEYVERGATPDSQPHAQDLMCYLDVCAAAGVEVAPPPLTPPRRISAPMPQYTEIARKARIQGSVVVQTVIDAEGGVRCLRAIKELPLGLTEVALEAVQKWKFEPGKSAGKSVPFRYVVSVNFRLQ